MKNRLGGRLVEISACDDGSYKDAMANVNHPGVFKAVRVLILFVVPEWRRCPDFPPLSLEFASRPWRNWLEIALQRFVRVLLFTNAT